jgi:hypothetical protein
MDDVHHPSLALPAPPAPVAVGPVAVGGKLLSFGSLDMAALLGGDATPTGSLADTPFVSFFFFAFLGEGGDARGSGAFPALPPQTARTRLVLVCCKENGARRCVTSP